MVNFGGTVQKNGIGLCARHGAFINASGAMITGNGTGILVEQSSTLEMLYGNISGTVLPAVVAQGSSSIRFDQVKVDGPSSNHTIFVTQGSSAHIDGSTITADTPFNANNQHAVIAAEGNSSVWLRGGITNSAAGGAAVMLSDGSTLQVGGVIIGDGRIHGQSVVNLGGAQWTGNIVVSQGSSFMAYGSGMVNGTLTLDQAANAYFNLSNAGNEIANHISHVQCKSTTDHVSNPNLVTPPVTIGPPPGCQLF